ncbi:MAG TPA: tRNA pseudouridine(38-40) synthase TruA [Nocardioides sp.]|nr:tRNA pseudouridine(38-40) synthase TruA [Nocardioides sp.]
MRLRIDLAYDGGDFHGWATQPGLRTVQGDLEAALATVLRLPEVSTVCAGRTDTGVHARGQVVHVDVESLQAPVPDSVLDLELALLSRRLNGVLAPDVRVRRVVTAADGFDARFSPLWRRYAYRVGDGVPDPLTRGSVLSWPRPLDADAMNDASRELLGLRDFASFCKLREGATTVRTLLELSWVREGTLLTGTVRADAFCHHMVRSLVGSLLAVGDGRRPTGWPAEVLAGRVRDPSVTVVPGRGLTLEEVRYPPDDELAAHAEQSRAKREPT